MGILAWTMMGLALWHFTIFLPDRWWSGIIGAFIGSVAGAVILGLAIHGFSIPGKDDTDVLTAVEAIPGTLIGLGIVWMIGVSQEKKHPELYAD